MLSSADKVKARFSRRLNLLNTILYLSGHGLAGQVLVGDKES
jgi:hypothetical protein